jgi:MFS family permease
MPLYFQVVRGASPTVSGLLTAPLLIGIFVLSLISGRVITRHGRYRVFPIIGTLCMAIGLSTLSVYVVGGSRLSISVSLALIGGGLGLSMHVMMLAAQNAVDRRDLGATSSAVACCRSLGSVFGVAYFSAILNARVASYLSDIESVPGASEAIDAALHGNPDDVQSLSDAAREGIVDVFARAYQTTLRWCVPIAVVGVVLAFRMRDVPLRETLDDELALDPAVASPAL